MDPLMKDLTGRAKRIAGAVTGNESLEAEGMADQAEANIDDLAGAVTDKASELGNQAAQVAGDLTEKATTSAKGHFGSLKDAFDEGRDND